MKVRYKRKDYLRGTEEYVYGWTSRFNTQLLHRSEVIVSFVEGDNDSMFIGELEVLLEKPLESSVYKPNVWIPMSEAFKSRDLIPSNHNADFHEPVSEAEKKRGWYDD